MTTITDDGAVNAYDLLNIYHHGGNTLLGPLGRTRVPVYINNTSGQRTVKLTLWGRKAGTDGVNQNHGIPAHTHNASASGSVATTSTGLALAAIPKRCQIFIDGTEKTSNIGVNGRTVGTEVLEGATSTADATEYTTASEIGSPATVKTLSSLNGRYSHILVDLFFTSAGYASNMFIEFSYSDLSTATSATATSSGANSTYVTHVIANPQPTKTVTQMVFKLYAQNGINVAKVKNITTGTYWGHDGTTEWSTGILDLSSTITWTAGWHYIDVIETGNAGGEINYHANVNTGP